MGNDKGFSVFEIINVIKKITNKNIPFVIEKRREGDPAVLFASSEKAKKLLDWHPEFNLESMIRHAWEWHKKLSLKPFLLIKSWK